MTLLRWWRTRRQEKEEHIRLIRKGNAEAEAIRRFEHDAATRAVRIELWKTYRTIRGAEIRFIDTITHPEHGRVFGIGSGRGWWLPNGQSTSCALDNVKTRESI